jgi:hypothetical protein
MLDLNEMHGKKVGTRCLNLIRRSIMLVASFALFLMLHSDADQRNNDNALIFDGLLVLPAKWTEYKRGIPNRGYLDSYPADHNK